MNVYAITHAKIFVQFYRGGGLSLPVYLGGRLCPLTATPVWMLWKPGISSPPPGALALRQGGGRQSMQSTALALGQGGAGKAAKVNSPHLGQGKQSEPVTAYGGFAGPGV